MFANGCLEVILPEAMQNECLFHVLVAMARSIHLLAQGKPPAEDAIVISHRGQALSSIQASISEITELTNDAVPALSIAHTHTHCL